jgi:AraC-like DNA-binding protein
LSEKNILKENAIHGNTAFPLCFYNNDVGYKEHLLDYHWHNEIEFLYLSKGKAVFQVDSTPIELHENEAIFINRGEIHSGYSLEHSYCVYYSIVFSLEMIYSTPQDICYDRYFKPLISGKYKLTQKITGKEGWEKEILEQIKNITKAFTEKFDGYEMDIKSTILKIFSLVYSNDAIVFLQEKREIAKNYQIERLKRILNFIKENYQDKISIEALSNEVNLTRYHFCRIFKSLTGQTPIEYINYFRINQALRLLEDENRKIANIALEVGFDNFSYFIEKFKEYKNCTPSEYRRSIL